MATTKRANVISANALAKAIDNAVSLASKRLDAELENGTLAFNWEIIGRQSVLGGLHHEYSLALAEA